MNILDVCPSPVYPPISGGTLRVHYLNLIAANYGHNVYLFTQDIRNIKELKGIDFIKEIFINNNYIEYRYINLISIIVNYITVSFGAAKIFTGDILKIFKPKILNKLIKKCNIIKVESPWQFNYIYDIAKKEKENKPIILVEHDANFKRLEYTIRYPKLFNKLYNIAIKKELHALEYADIVFTVSEDDKKQLISKFNINKDKIYVIPNGVDISRFTPSTPTEKNMYKRQIVRDIDKKVILFVGSLYYPNIEAVKYIINEIAPKVFKHYKNCLFIIVGGVGDYFKIKNINLGNNILVTGRVNNIIPYFKIADIALNPVLSGSGTNIKMLEYMASGLPIVTTKIGARGLDLKHGKHVIISEIDEFPEWIKTLLEDEDLRDKLSINGRKLVEEKYDWKKIAEKELEILEGMEKM